MEWTISETKDLDEVARALIAELSSRNDDKKKDENDNSRHAMVVCLSGELGAGKTTFTQALARTLVIKETVQSPTFVIARFYDIGVPLAWEKLVHIDAYRIESLNELGPIGFPLLLSDPKNLIVIEWPEKISGALPFDVVAVSFDVVNETTRKIRIQKA
jgi:tRNA threonylcarbamoyladenosine biosynthesis protein TsaE